MKVISNSQSSRHLNDIEYEWYLAGAPYKQKVAGKAVNECGVNAPQQGFSDKKYLDEIVAKVD